MGTLKNWLVCVDCDHVWNVSEGRFCPMCKAESKPDGEKDDGGE